MGENEKITRKTIDAFWSKVAKGTRLVCLANTYRGEDAVGATGVMEKTGKTSMMLREDDGKTFWLYPPRNVSGVVALTEDTITYKIGNEDHTATWRIAHA